jgi:hypothetical protein
MTLAVSYRHPPDRAHRGIAPAIRKALAIHPAISPPVLDFCRPAVAVVADFPQSLSTHSRQTAMTPIAGIGQGYNTLVNSLRQIGERVSNVASVVADPTVDPAEQTLATAIDLTKLKGQARAAATVLYTLDDLSTSLLRAPRK